ncbi:hypothetical protein ACIBHX_01590 [Nonomuraea sp. NPDC050536]|uniref:hypothetical protein n=1 Tax=Nonomuraea sp. NPDC050536 TaxID=3364366 RepID=UPI0037CA7B79
MKRSPMPPRKSPLTAKKPMNRSNGFKQVLKPWKAKSRPETAPKNAIVYAKNRSKGLCEIGLVCFGSAPATETAHRRGKGSGGVGPKNTTAGTAANLLRGCHACHAHIDNAQVADAERLGLKLRHGVARPSELPVLHYRLGWVLLDDEGGYRAAPAASHAGGVLLPVIACTSWELINQDGAFIEAMERFGHVDCPGWAPPRPGPFLCGCGSTPFYLEEVA